MRPRFLLACLLIVLASLAVATSVGAASGPLGRYAKSDGTLSVQNGRGAFALQGMRGLGPGPHRQGDADDHRPRPGRRRGADRARLQVDQGPVRDTTQYGRQEPIRFRILGGRFDLRVESAVGVELSVVGRGRAMLDGAGFTELGLSDGEYSLNGTPYVRFRATGSG